MTDEDIERWVEELRGATEDQRLDAAIGALSMYYAMYARDAHGDGGPDHSWPEDEADAFAKAIVEASTVLYDKSDPRELPRHVLSTGVG